MLLLIFSFNLYLDRHTNELFCRQSDAHAYVQKNSQTHGHPIQLHNIKASLCLGIEIDQLGHILCWYDTCPTHYAPNFMDVRSM